MLRNSCTGFDETGITVIVNHCFIGMKQSVLSIVSRLLRRRKSLRQLPDAMTISWKMASVGIFLSLSLFQVGSFFIKVNERDQLSLKLRQNDDKIFRR